MLYVQVKEKLITTKTNRAAAKQAASKADQQLAASRLKRLTLQRQLAQQCELLLPVGAAAAWDQVVDLCADMPADSSQQWAAEAVELSAMLQEEGDQLMHAQAEHGADALSCLRSLLVRSSSTSLPDLAAWVKAQLQAAASLTAAIEETKQLG